MKKLSFFLMAMLFSVMSFAAETVAYTLTPAATGGNSSPHNAYASAADWTYEGITWNVTGNSYMVPWRIGGKSLTNIDRAVYTKTALAADVTKIEITHATVNITCNSCTLTVSDAANGAGETFPVKVAQNTTTTITLPEGDYSNKFYKLVYNVTNSTTSNKYVQLSEIKFYTEVQTSVEAPTFTPEEGKVDANKTFAEPFALTIASATADATIKYTLDGTDPTLETALTYEAPITISTMVQVRAIAVKGEEKSVESATAYITRSSEEKPYTATEAITAQALGLAANVYVTGTVKSIEELSTQYGNATYNITDGVKELKIYRGKNLENAKFTSADQLLVGDVVVVKGDLTSYNGAAQLGQNNYLISRSTPVVNHTVTVTANAEGENVVSGAGEYEEGEEVTVTASEDLEGWVFIGWTEDGEFVANDPEYTFVVKGDVELVAVYAMDLGKKEVTDLVIDGDNKLLTGSVADFPMGTMNLELALGEYDEEEGMYLLTEESKLYVGETNCTFVDGMALVDMESNAAMAIVVFELEEAYYYMMVDMSAAPAEPVDLVVTDATIYEENEILFLTAPWEGKTIKAELPATEHQGWMMIEIHEGEDFSIAMSQNATIATVDNVLTINGVFTDNNSHAVYNVTISGTLPVVEPEVIAYELNGGELVVEVPTQEELWASFKTAAGLTTLGTLAEITEAGAGKPHNDPEDPCACRIICAKLLDANVNAVFALPEWAWLKAYIMTVQSGLPEASNVSWRYAFAAFFLQSQHSAYPASADFTEAGKPEAWGTAYQAAHAVVLPTEPVDAPYTLPTPVKEGYKFVGWYDNAEGKDEPYTVIPAGWSGTLYAIWEVQGPTTALDNIAVEAKAIKMIKNGQLIIIKNGVQYNALGQEIK